MLKSKSMLAITSVYPRFDKDQEVPWLRESLARLKGAGFGITVLAPASRACPGGSIDGIEVRRFRYAPAKLEILTHDEGAPAKMAKNPLLQLLAIPYIISGTLLALRLCKEKRPGLIHAHWPFPHGIIALIAKAIFKTPVALNFHGAELLLMRKKKWIKPIMKFLIKKADLIIANSSFTAKKINELLPCPVTISPYGTTFADAGDDTVTGNDDVRALPATPLHNDSPFTVLFVGRHIERKGIKYLIRAAALLDSGRFQIRIAGQGNLTEALKAQAAKEAPAHAIFLGKLSKEDLAKEYQSAGCFMLPAIVDSKGDTEGLGVVLIEAAEYGLPIIASNVGGIGDVVIDRQTGLLVPEKSPEALAAAIKELSESPALRQALAAGAKAHIKAHFSWDAIIERQVAAYNNIA